MSSRAEADDIAARWLIDIEKHGQPRYRINSDVE